jgi:predicted acetyltransferase
MRISQTSSTISLEVIAASPKQEQILANLLELYIYDFSEFIDLQLNEEGRFGYKRLPLYWSEPDRHPFLVKVNGHWAGFVLVKRGSEILGDSDMWDVAEFFIVRGQRRCGIGTKVAHEVWNMYPGKWQVRVREGNEKALIVLGASNQ